MASRNLGSLTIDLVAKTAGFEAGMDKAARSAAKRSKEIQTGFTNSFKSIGAAIAGFVAGLALVDTAIRGLNQAIDSADRLDELSARFNVSTETLSEWGYALKLTGSDLDSFASVIPKFSKNIAEAADSTSQLGKVFKALGIDAIDPATGKLSTVEQLLPKVADAFKGITDDTLKTNLALQLFGKSGAEMLEFLSLGSDGLRQFADRAKELGIVIDSGTAAAAAQFNDRLDDLKAASQGLFTQIAAQLLPVLTKTTVEFTNLVKSGDLASNMASVFSGILSAGVGTVNAYNRAVYGLALTFEATAKAASGLWEANKNLITFGAADGTVVAGFKRIQGASDEATASWNAYNKAQQEAAAKAASPFATVTGRALGDSDYESLKKQEQAAKDAAKAQAALQNLLTDPGGKAKETVDKLQERYKDLAASLHEQIDLFGQVGQEAKIRYDLEHTELAALSSEQKDYLIDLAKQADSQELIADLQKAANEEIKKRDEERQRGIEDADHQIAQMQQELDLLSMTNKQRAVAVELANLSADATDEQRAKVEQLAKAYQDTQEQIAVMDDLRDSFGDFFEDVLSGTKSVKDAFSDMLADIGKMIAKRIAQNWVDQLFGQQGQSGGGAAGGTNWGQWISTFASWFAGGRASGGNVSPGQFVEVNESGIEMATVNGRSYMLAGNSPVQVTPNHKLGGGGNTQVINFTVPGQVDRRTGAQIAQEVGQQTTVAMRRNS